MRYITLFLFTTVIPTLALAENSTNLDTPTKAILGKLLFNDTQLSEPAGQSCNSCHRADAFHSDPNNMVSPGANPALFGNRNAPAISYIKFNPELYWDDEEQHWVGGFFLDGRAFSLRQQAAGPFTNPLEMGNADNASVVAKVKVATYASMLEELYGEDIWNDETKAMDAITDAIATYESGPEFATFTSKYDYYLKGKVKLTALEQKGLEVFEAEDKGNCAACHPNRVGDNMEPPLFTDFTYDNLGLPRPDKLPFFSMAKSFNSAGEEYVDTGLANNPHIDNASVETGKFKVLTLRNIDKTPPYMHNGIFETLEEVVDFYNTRDVKDSWGKPEIMQNLNTEELGDLKLTDGEVEALVAFMKTLTDGFVPPSKLPPSN